MAAALREVLARFGVSFDSKELEKGDKAVDGVAAKLAKFGATLVGAAIVKGVADFITGMADQADALHDQAAALGLSAAELQEWQYAAKLSGVEAAELSGALMKFNKNVADAAAGTGPAADAFRSLGVNVKDSAGKLGQPIDLLGGIAEGLQKIQNPAERTATLMSLFGKSGAKLGPLFDQGAEGIAKLRAEVEDLGGGFSPEFVESAGDMNDSIDRLNFSWLSFKAKLAGLIIPTINRFVVLATKVTSSLLKWIKVGTNLQSVLGTLAVAALVFGRAMVTAGVKAIVPWLPMIAALGLAYLALNELIVLWQGGDTIIGRAIDSIFGEGTAKKIVDTAHEITDMFTQAGNSSEDFYRVVDGVWKSIVLAASIAAETVRNIWQGVGATIYDALNDPFREQKNADIDKQIEELRRTARPGFEETTKLDIAKLEAQKEKSQGEINEARHAAEVQAKIAEYERVAKQLDPKLHSPAAKSEAAMRETGLIGPGLPPGYVAQAQVATATAKAPSTVTIQNHTPVNVTVAPGTPPQLMKALGEAAGKGAEQNNLATQRALVKTAG